jgi:hypothetical protein
MSGQQASEVTEARAPWVRRGGMIWPRDQWRNFGTSINKRAFGKPANGIRVFCLVAGRRFDLTEPSLSFGESRGYPRVAL